MPQLRQLVSKYQSSINDDGPSNVCVPFSLLIVGCKS